MKDVSRRNTLKKITAAIACAGTGWAFSTISHAAEAAKDAWWRKTPEMDAMTTIRTRRSVRKFTDKPVDEQTVRELLGAAMSAPSAGNEQPWEFIVVRDKELLKKIGDINEYAGYAHKAPVSILTCGNLKYSKFKSATHEGYWVEDVSAATQNLLLAAHALGLGAVWTGIHPFEDRMAGFKQLFRLPQEVLPLALVVVGYPASTLKPVDRYKQERVHTDYWQG